MTLAGVRPLVLGLSVLTGLAGALYPLAASQQPAARPPGLTALDYADIKRVVGQYNLGWDSTGRVDAGALVGRAFTPDAIFYSPTGPWIGRARIAEAAATTKSGINHWVSNLLIDAAPDGGATSWSYVLLTNVADSGRPIVLTGGGILHEAFTKTPDGWQLKYRRYEAVGTTPSINWPQPEQGRFVPVAEPGESSGSATGRGTLSPADYIAIEQLYIKNNIAFDSGADEGQRFARTFTPDGVIVSADGTRVAGEMLAGQPRATHREPGLRTWMTNLLIEPSPDGATGRVYLLTANLSPRTADRPAAYSIAEGRSYSDVLVKTADGWRFKERRYTVHPAR